MRKIRKERGFLRLPSEVQNKLNTRYLDKEDALFCLLKARSRNHAWLAEILWENVLMNTCDKDDCLFLLEHCPNLELQVCNKFLGLYPTNSELRYASTYALNDAIKTVINMTIARRDNNVVEFQTKSANQIDQEAECQLFAG